MFDRSSFERDIDDIQVDFIKTFRFLWGDLKFNFFYKGFLYRNRIYPYNHILNVENLIVSTKCKKINIYYNYL